MKKFRFHNSGPIRNRTVFQPVEHRDTTIRHRWPLGGMRQSWGRDPEFDGYRRPDEKHRKCSDTHGWVYGKGKQIAAHSGTLAGRIKRRKVLGWV